MTARINGFQILRKSLQDDEVYKSIYRLGDKEYRGIIRDHLGDLIDEFYEKKLPDAINRIYKQSNDETNIVPSVQLIRNYEDAKTVMEYINRKNNLNELTVIYSDVLTEVRGAIDFEAERIEWLGYDVYVFGGWSFILEGIFFRPAYFSKWAELLNQNGLFPSKIGVDEFIQDYLVCGKDNLVEPYNPAIDIIDTIRVGRATNV
jgi:hypothetical protein